jgi:hypothetical protein
MATINTIRDFPLILDFGSAGKLDVKVVVETSSRY